MSVREHWDNVYASKGETEVSWFQENPEHSLALIRKYAADKMAGIIDVGGGAARLVDRLLDAGYSDLSVLDISMVGLDQAKDRLGQAADRVNWIVADITRWRPNRTWMVWHDRAVFHFLVDPTDQELYVKALSAATRVGATTIIATFALDGPDKCSGLPVQRYSAKTLAIRLGVRFRLLEEAKETHLTPGGVQQHFNSAVFERV